MGPRLFLLLALFAPKIKVSCGPIPEELAMTSIGLMPLAYIAAALLYRGVYRPAPSLDAEDDEPPRDTTKSFVAGLVVLVACALPAMASPNFEGGAIIAGLLFLVPAAIGYTIVLGTFARAEGFQNAGGWIPQTAAFILIVPWLATAVSEGEMAEGFMTMGMMVTLVSALGVVPLAMLVAAWRALFGGPNDEDALEDDP